MPRRARGGYFFRRLFLTALVPALPVVALFGWTLQSAVQDAERQATASVLAHSAEIARRLEATLARLDVVSDVLLAREEVATMDATRCGTAMRDLPRVDPLILNVGLFDLEGRPLCLAREAAQMPASFRNSVWFRDALAQDRRVLTRPYFSPASGRTVLSMASPVRDEDGRRIGVLGLSIDLERLSSTLLRGQLLPPGAAVGVVNAEGVIVARTPDTLRWIGRAAAAGVLAQAPTDAASAAFQGTGADGVARTFGFAAMNVDGWRVFAGVPTAHFDELMRETSRQSAGALVAALLLGLGASWAGARWLARPLQGLAATARRLAEGDESARADESQPGEVGQLGAEFNHMVRSLVESRNDERVSSAQFLQLFHAIPVAASVQDAEDGTLLEVNDTFCRDHGIARSEAIGRTLAALGLALDPEALGVRDAQLREAGEIRGLEAELRGRDGAERTLLLSAERIDRGGRPCVLEVHVDITDRRRADKLQAASAAKTAFLSRMSHELRTPLNAILGFSQLLHDAAGERLAPAELRQLELVQRAGRQLGALIDDVLDVSRIEAGALRLQPEPLDLGTAVDEALQLTEAAAAGAAVRLLPPGPDAPRVVVEADPTRLRQVLLNLLSNAVKYNRPGGEVRVTLARRGAEVRLAVQDTGIGMSEAQRLALFQPFNRLGHERGPIPGTGIGLVLSRHLVEMLGGRLEVASQEGEGTTVTVSLPAAAADATAADRPTAVAAALPAEATEPWGHVLYIEDNPVNALIVEQMLLRWPQVSLQVAPDGATGLASARERPPDLMLLDMQLPDIDGLEVLRRLRDDPVLQSLPVIALSAGTMADEVAAARAAGADDFWPKPFDIPTVLRGLRERLPARTLQDADSSGAG